MRSVGQQLRDARQAQGRTLEELNSRTRISFKNLEAIEADQLAGISSAFLYKSFVRQVAEVLGLDYGPLELQVQAAAGQMPAPRIPGEGLTAAPKVAALPVGRKKSSRLLYSLSSFALVVIACSGIYAVWQNAKIRSSVSWQALARKTHLRSQSAPKKEAIANSSPTGNNSSAVPRRNPERVTSSPQVRRNSDRPPDSFTLELSATEPAWLSIVADGKQSFKGILERAETKVLEGHNTARIRTGNAGGVKAVFNGRPLGALGPRGQIRTVVFTTNDYEVLDAPARVATVGFSRNAALTWPAQPLVLFPGS